MITWEYRVFHEENGDYIIREVFYDDNGVLSGCTADAVEPVGRTVEELARDIASFQAALSLPVLTLADIPVPPRERVNHDHQHNRSLEDVIRDLDLEPAIQNKTA